MAALLALALQLSGALSSAELLIRDALLRTLPARAASRVAVVLIDDAAVHAAGRWPWDRARLARLVDRVFEAGAKGVALDLLLPEEGNGDDRLAQALGRGPSVLAVGLDDTGRWLPPNGTLGAIQQAHVSFDLDRDGVVRHFASTKQVGDRSLAAFPVAVARLGDARLPVPVGQVLRPGFRTRPIPTLSAAALLDPGSPEGLRDRIVLIGTSAAGVGDRFISPVSRGGSPEPGVLLEAISAEAILSRDLLRPAPPLLNTLLALGLGFLGALLLASGGRSLPLFLTLLALAPFAVAGASLQVLDLEMAPLTVTLALLLVGALAGGLRSNRARVAMSEARDRISELEGLQVALAETRRQDAEARRVVAHELKTPLTSVKGLAQLLAQFDLSPAERNRVALMVVSETSRLAQMVDALLDLERLRLRDHGRDALALDLSALCAERADFLRAGTRRDLLVDLAPGLHVQGDKALLQRVIENLVSNAIKFSPEGSPVHFALKREGSQALLEIEDRGPGVPPEERERIFGRFARGSSSEMAPGLGLGLALVAEVVAWHLGAVEVDEGPGGGSLFRVRLPLSPPRG